MSSFLLEIEILQKPEIEDHQSFSLAYSTSTKFEKDKVNFENDDYYIVLDGIVLNQKHLLNSTNQQQWATFLIDLYKHNGDQFFKQLKGSYYGFLFDKKANKWIIFTDHISSKPMYFAEFDNRLFFSNSYTELLNRLKKKGKRITLNEQGAYVLLSYGYVFEDFTITNEIKRLMVGYYAFVQDGNFAREKFYTLRNDPVEISEKDAIEQIDKRFREAVELAFEKDKEYGYKHIASLSGGLDSRMTVWVAHDLGYTDQLNLTFSQSDYLDETNAKRIASDLRHEWLFKALDNGNFLKNIDEVTRISGGNILYYGLAHGLSLYDKLDFKNLGIMHTGQLGDVAKGTYSSTPQTNKQFVFGDGAYSKKLLQSINNFSFKEDYPNEESFKMYIRGFYGINSGLLSIMERTETYSPFYDIDFMEFALSLPLKLRFNHYIYKKWILAKYPKASHYVWEKTKKRINRKEIKVKIMGKYFPVKQILPRILVELGIKKHPLASKNHMNPLEYWYNTNPTIKQFQDSYFEANILSIENTQIRNDCEMLYKSKQIVEKNQVLSLLAAIKQINK